MPKYADLHIHSKYSSVSSFQKSSSMLEKMLIDCASDVEKIFILAKKRGLSAIAIADHNNQLCVPEAEKLSKKYGVVFIPAVEVGSIGGHVVSLGVKANFEPLQTVSDTIDEIKARGGIAVAAHPFPSHRHFITQKIIKKGVSLEDVNTYDFDAVESHNSIFGEFLARSQVKSGLAFIAGSDAHTYYQIGRYKTIFPDWCETKEDYLKAIRSGQTETTGAKPYFWPMALQEVKAQLWDRFFLSLR